MPRVVFAPALARWLTASPKPHTGQVACEVSGRTVREVLNEVFRHYPTLKPYVLDEHGTVRHHVVLYLDNAVVTDKDTLLTPVQADSELSIFQALSGG